MDPMQKRSTSNDKELSGAVTSSNQQLNSKPNQVNFICVFMSMGHVWKMHETILSQGKMYISQMNTFLHKYSEICS